VENDDIQTSFLLLEINQYYILYFIGREGADF